MMKERRKVFLKGGTSEKLEREGTTQSHQDRLMVALYVSILQLSNSERLEDVVVLQRNSPSFISR